jgi:hypothetical protein
MAKKVEADVVMRDVVKDVRGVWFPLTGLILKVSFFLGVWHVLVYRVLWDNSLEGFLSVVSLRRLVSFFLGGEDDVGSWSGTAYVFYVILTVVGTVCAQSSVGNTVLRYGMSGMERSERGLRLWGEGSLSFLRGWVLLNCVAVGVSTMVTLVVSFLLLGLGSVLGLQAVPLLSYGVGYMVACYVMIRCGLIFPGLARGMPMGFAEGWRISRGQGWSLLGIAFCVFVIPGMFPTVVGLIFGMLAIFFELSPEVRVLGSEMLLFVLRMWALMLTMVLFVGCLLRVDRILRGGGG